MRLKQILSRFRGAFGSHSNPTHDAKHSVAGGSVGPIVFLSHASEDKSVVRTIANYLTRAGADAWLDEGEIRPGDNFVDKIVDGVGRADFVIVVLSPHSADSAWVAREVQEAQKYKGKKLLPLMIKDCVVPRELDDINYVRMTTPESVNGSLETLLASLSLYLPTSSDLSLEVAHERLSRLSAGVPRFEAILSELSSVGMISNASCKTFSDVTLPHPLQELFLYLLTRVTTGIAQFGVGALALTAINESGVGKFALERCLLDEQFEDHWKKSLASEMSNVTSRDAVLFCHQQLTHVVKDSTRYHSFFQRHKELILAHSQSECVAYLLHANKGPEGYALDIFFDVARASPATTGLVTRWLEWIEQGRLDYGAKCHVHWSIVGEILRTNVDHLAPIASASRERVVMSLKSSDLTRVNAAFSNIDSILETKCLDTVLLAYEIDERVSGRAEIRDWPTETKRRYLKCLERLKSANEPECEKAAEVERETEEQRQQAEPLTTQGPETGTQQINQVIAKALGKPIEEVEAEDYKTITVLGFNDEAYGALLVSDLSPLHDLTALRELSLNGSSISDLNPLQGLTDLQVLDIGQSRSLSDIAPLQGLRALRKLTLSYSKVSDLSPLQGLSTLQCLDLTATNVSDLTPLRGLTNLQRLGLWGTQVSDISPLQGLAALQVLQLTRVEVSDLAPLQGLTALKELELWLTRVSDLTPIQDLTALKHLSLNDTEVSDLTPLHGLTALEYLSLRHTKVSDLTPLRGLTALRVLDLDGTEISKAESAALRASLPNLKIIGGFGNQP